MSDSVSPPTDQREAARAELRRRAQAELKRRSEAEWKQATAGPFFQGVDSGAIAPQQPTQGAMNGGAAFPAVRAKDPTSAIETDNGLRGDAPTPRGQRLVDAMSEAALGSVKQSADALFGPIKSSAPDEQVSEFMNRAVMIPGGIFGAPLAAGSAALDQVQQEALTTSDVPGDLRRLIGRGAEMANLPIKLPQHLTTGLQDAGMGAQNAELSANAITALVPMLPKVARGLKGLVSKKAPIPSPKMSMRTKILHAIDEADLAQKAEVRGKLIAENKPVPREFQSPQMTNILDALEGAIRDEDAGVPVPEKPAGPKPQLPGGRPRGNRQSGEVINPVAAAHDALVSAYDKADVYAAAAVGKVGPAISKVYSEFKSKVPEGGTLRGALDMAEDIAARVRDEALTHPVRHLSEEAQFAHIRHGAALNEARKTAATRTMDFATEVVDKLTDEGEAAMHRYMSGETDVLPDDVAPYKAQIDAESAFIDMRSEQLVDLYALSREAKDQFKRYLPRLYQRTPENTRGMFRSKRASVSSMFTRDDKFAVRVPNTTYEAIKPIAAEHGGFAVTQGKGGWQVKFETPEARNAFKKAAREAGIDTSKAKNRNPIPPELADVIDRDASRGIYTALLNIESRIAHAKLLQAFDKMPDVVLNSADDVEGYTRVKKGSSWAGPLRKKLVRDAEFKYLDENLTRAAEGEMRKAYKSFLKEWKGGKVLNFRTAFRQFFGNTAFLKAGGVDPMNPGNASKLVEGWNSMRKGAPRYAEMIENGIITENSLVTADFDALGQILGDTNKSHGEKIGAFFGNPWKKLKPYRAFQDKIAQHYNVPDSWTRATLYNEYRNQGLSQLEATMEVNKFTPNAALSAPIARRLSNSLLGGPFTLFKFESMRVMKNLAKEHPVRFATYLAHMEMARRMMGAGLEELEETAADTALGAQQMFTGMRDEKGQPLFLDLKWIRVIGDLFPDVERLGEDNTLEWLLSLTGLEESIGMEAYDIARHGKDRHGRRLSKANAGTAEKLADRGKEMFELSTPASVEHVSRVGHAFAGEPYGSAERPVSPWLTLLAYTVGLPMRPLEAQPEVQELIKRKDALLREAESPGERREILDEFRDKMGPLRGAQRAARAFRSGDGNPSTAGDRK